MPPEIQSLPVDVVHHIAAGEVIDSWASAVQELAENALDAGATRISIGIWPAQWQLRVTDNGIGMGLEDLRRAATPHSTSKIRTEADLWQIGSLGFRGEALHSLSQAGRLEICSRLQSAAPEVSGWRLRYAATGEPLSEAQVAIAPGTVVTVSDLFGLWPARRLGLPSFKQQLQAMQRTLQQMALCHPQVTWQVSLDDRPWFVLAAAASPQVLLPQMLKSVAASDLRETTVRIAVRGAVPIAGDLYLLAGLPDRCHRRRPDWIRTAVNGRCVDIPELEQAVINAFRFTLPRDRYPVCWLHLRLSPDHIDWNRHPHKSAIYLHQIDAWTEQVRLAIESLLRLHPDSLSFHRQQRQVGDLLKTAEAAGHYSLSDSLPAQPVLLRAVAQVQNRYILAEHPNGIYLIEQHIAHERVLYEKLCEEWRIVPLDTPVLLKQLSDRQLEQLERLGLDVDLFGPQLWAVRSAPAPLANREDLADALLELSLGSDLDTALVATACRTAIRNGKPLPQAYMQRLVSDWQRTRHPNTCPHGRPICLSLEESSLARFFRRHWVIGKSHGIESPNPNQPYDY